MSDRKYRVDFDYSSDHAIQYLVALLQDTRHVTLQIVDRLGEDEVNWQPLPGWNTIGALLDHIAAIEHYFRIEFVEERKLTDSELERWTAAMDMGEHLPKLIGIKTIENYRTTLNESRELLLTALQQISFADFTKRRPDYDDVEGCNLAWVLYHMMEDEIYHRGQISMIRKLYKESFGKSHSRAR